VRTGISEVLTELVPIGQVKKTKNVGGKHKANQRGGFWGKNSGGENFGGISLRSEGDRVFPAGTVESLRGKEWGGS